MYLKIY